MTCCVIIFVSCATSYMSHLFNVSSQFMEATRRGLFGLSVVIPVVQDGSIVLVPAQIHGQHTEDDGVAALNQVEKHGNVTFGPAQVHCLTSCHNVKLLKVKTFRQKIYFIS